MLFVFAVRLVAGALAALGLFGLRDGGCIVLSLPRCSEELVEEGKRRGLAVGFVVLAVLFGVTALAEQALQAVHGLGHFAVEVFEVVLRKPHALDHIIDGLDAHLFGAFEAKALVDGLSAVDLRYKNDCKILFAS